MGYYLFLLSITQQGIEHMKQIPNRVEDFKKLCESKGVTIHGHYFTFGKYDVVLILQADDDEKIMSTILSLEKLGNVRSETLKAFTYEEAKTIIEKL